MNIILNNVTQKLYVNFNINILYPMSEYALIIKIGLFCMLRDILYITDYECINPTM